MKKVAMILASALLLSSSLVLAAEPTCDELHKKMEAAADDKAKAAVKADLDKMKCK